VPPYSPNQTRQAEALSSFRGVGFQAWGLGFIVM
jgi:hypothetical protein